jgi:hypothetical protein
VGVNKESDIPSDECVYRYEKICLERVLHHKMVNNTRYQSDCQSNIVSHLMEVMDVPRKGEKKYM